MSKTTEQIYNELLVIRCQSGEEPALEELIRLWQKRLGRTVWRLTDGHSDGEDIVQNIWMTVVRRLKTLHDPAAFPQWLYRIATAACADWVRKQQRIRNMSTLAGKVELISESTSQSRGSEQTAKSLIRQGLSRLDSDQRLILTLFYIDELSTATIAEVLNIPVGTVKSRLHNARNELRKQIERSTL